MMEQYDWKGFNFNLVLILECPQSTALVYCIRMSEGSDDEYGARTKRPIQKCG